MPNLTGGKGYKKFKTGSMGFRAVASNDAAEDMLDLWRKAERLGKDKMEAEDKEALLYMFAGRVVRRFGHGRMEVICHDDVTRQCRIRGLLRKKGQVFIDIDSVVVVSTREAVESEEEDNTGVSSSHAAGGTADIIGLFDDKRCAMLRKTSINRILFSSTKSKNGEIDGGDDDDMFDRSELIGEEPEQVEGKPVDPSARAAAVKERTAGRTTAINLKNSKNEITDIDIDNI